MRMTS